VHKELTALFCPKSIAVVGASRSQEKVGSIVLRNIIASGYEGRIYPVNPNAEKINDLISYSNIDSLPEIVDLAVVALPVASSLEVLNEIAAKGIKNFVLYAAGFKETGPSGLKSEETLLELAKKYNLNILGPNCLGFVNTNCRLNTTFGQSFNDSGNIKFISQSGAIAAGIFDWAKSIGLGFSEFITLGNKSVINETDILEYFLQQSLKDNDKVGFPIGMYLESISNGPAFLRLTKQLSTKHPIFLIKPGKTPAAASAMKSHTGSLAGEDDVLDAALKQVGIIRCQTLEDFFDVTRAFSWGKVQKGNKVAVISNAGGPGVLSADAVVLHGMDLISFDDKTKKKLEEVLPRSASILDPVDLMGDALAERFGHAAEIIIENSEVDYLLFILTPQLMTQIEKTAEYISYVSQKYTKPIFCSFIGGNLIAEGEKILNKNKIPVFRYPERAIYAMSVLNQFSQNIGKPVFVDKSSSPLDLSKVPSEITNLFQEAVSSNSLTLDNFEADLIMQFAGIQIPSSSKISTYEEALEFAKKVGWPVVLKLSGHGLLHKKKLGGVITSIHNEETLKNVFSKISSQISKVTSETVKDVSIQIQKEINGGLEVIIGLKNDPVFGPITLFGAGGSFVELIADKNIAVLPLDIDLAKSLVSRSKMNKILVDQGYPVEKLYDALVRISSLVNIFPNAGDIEVNPLIVTKDSVIAVDSKVLIKNTSQAPTSEQKQKSEKKISGPQYRSAKVLSHETLASKFNHYKFEADAPLNFLPGQYISVKVAETAIRAYSVATRSDDKHFDLLVDTRPGGPGSQYFENLKAGDVMQYLGPFGKFVLNENDGSENLLFLATGSGASAVRCMIDVSLNELNISKPMKLYFGLTNDSEIFWQDHFEELKRKHPNFSYEIVICKPSEKWTGSTGFVTQSLLRDYPDASKCSAYLCGHKNMITDVTELLGKNGCPSERIYSERFA
jgi:acetyltransferase